MFVESHYERLVKAAKSKNASFTVPYIRTESETDAIDRYELVADGMLSGFYLEHRESDGSVLIGDDTHIWNPGGLIAAIDGFNGLAATLNQFVTTDSPTDEPHTAS